MANDIKQRIILEGEGEYKRALQDANRNLKTLRSELKAETAELGKNATEQQKAAVKTKNLQKQIQEQEKAVKTHRDALEEVRKKYGDNEEAVAKYEQRLNNARAALASMKNELDAVDRSYDAVTDGAKRSVLENNALAESFGRIGEAAGNISGIIENAFSGMLKTVKSTVGAIWGELMDIAAKSDNYMDLASYFGASATEVQKWDSAMKAAAGDMSTVTGLITKLKYSGKEKSVAEWFGISAENYTNDLEYFQAVMQQMVDNRDEMIRNGTWNTAMADIFGGKKGFDVEGILSDWDDILNGLQKFNADEGGYGASEDQIEKMAQLNVQVQTLKESWQQLKKMATIQLFGDLAIRITGNMQNILDAFKDYLTADNEYAKKEALESIKRNVREMFEAIRDAIRAGLEVLDSLAEEFENSDNPTEKTIGGLLRGLKNTIEWLADPTHWEDIKKGIEIVLGVWLFSKLAKVSTKLLGIVTNLRTISAFKGLGGTAGAAAEAGTGTGISTIASGTGSGLTSLLGSLAVPVAGLSIVAATVYLAGKTVADINDSANKAREVATDTERYANLSNEQKGYLQSFVRSIQKETGGSAQIAPMLQQFAQKMGPELMSVFNYTNTSGEKRNKLVDMLGMTEVDAAIAAMMMQAAGIDTTEYGSMYSNGLGKWNEFMQNGRTDFSAAYSTLAGLGGFFDRSGTFVNGKFTIPGFSGYNPYGGGGPNPWELSGYAMTTNKPTFMQNWSGGRWVDGEWQNGSFKSVSIGEGTWDPAAHMSDWWRNQGVPENQKIEMSDSSITGMKRAVADGVSGIRVYMDGVAVGHLVAPTVSEDIARAVP